jgi:hypothetical protein
VRVSNEAKKLFFSLSVSLSLIPCLPFVIKKTQSTQIIAYFDRLLFFALAISSFALKSNPFFYSFLFLLFSVGKEENIKWNLLPDIEEKKREAKGRLKLALLCTYVSTDEQMNSDISYVRAYIAPLSSSDHHHLSSSNSNGNYQRLLHRRQEVCNSAKNIPGSATTFEQTLTFIEQLKRNQHRSVTEMNRVVTQIPKEHIIERRNLTPQELCYQLNLKLEYLIRTRAIEQHRVINRTNLLPTPRITRSKTTPRENLNKTSLAYLNQSREKNVVSSTTITTNTTLVQDDLIDKDSFGDNDEAFEEMVEEENLNFIQQQP